MTVFLLRVDKDRMNAINAVRTAHLGMEVEVRKAKRTTDQNSAFHALCSDISKQLPWPKGGEERHNMEWWKRRLTLGWLKDKRQEVEIITDLDGVEVGLLLPHTSDLPIDKYSDLIEWTSSFGIDNGVVFTNRAPAPPVEVYR